MSITEAEWMASSDPEPMVRLLWAEGSKRKLRLFAVACCQRILPSVGDACFRAALTAAEDFADGLVSMDQVEDIAAEYLVAPMAQGSWLNPEIAAICVTRFLPNRRRHDDPAGIILDFIPFIHRAVAGLQGNVNSESWQMAYKVEQEVESIVLRDIFDNPFRPSPPLSAAVLAWNDSTVRRIAEGIYDERRMPEGTLDSGRLAILADALLDAGCDDEDLLAHCRSEGPHVRGCWALDLILRKE